jgi:hypothetical protein
MSKPKLRMVCATCGSDQVLADAFAKWDVESQQWYLHATYDKGSVCESDVCDGAPRRIDEEIIDDADTQEAQSLG